MRGQLAWVLAWAAAFWIVTRKKVWAWVVLLPPRLFWRLLTRRK